MQSHLHSSTPCDRYKVIAFLYKVHLFIHTRVSINCRLQFFYIHIHTHTQRVRHVLCPFYSDSVKLCLNCNEFISAFNYRHAQGPTLSMLLSQKRTFPDLLTVSDDFYGSQYKYNKSICHIFVNAATA